MTKTGPSYSLRFSIFGTKGKLETYTAVSALSPLRDIDGQQWLEMAMPIYTDIGDAQSLVVEAIVPNTIDSTKLFTFTLSSIYSPKKTRIYALILVDIEVIWPIPGIQAYRVYSPYPETLAQAVGVV